jgi:regulator of replication initiation timing
MKRITSIEIQCLKELLKGYRDRNIMLSIENDELRKQLEESRAKEGKGALERFADEIADAVAGIGKMFSTMHPDELKALIEANDCDEEETT